MATLTIPRDRTSMMVDNAGGVAMSNTFGVVTTITWNTALREPDPATIDVDTANNRFVLKRTGWYKASCIVSLTNAAGTYQGSLGLYRNGAATTTGSASGFIFTPSLGILTCSLVIPEFVFEITTADTNLDARVQTVIAAGSGTTATAASRSHFTCQYLGAS